MVDEILTGRENLIHWGRLFHLPARAAARRADELLDQFGLTEAAHRRTKHYSGGMRRRLDLASSLVLAPRVYFLDEPTTGLDPRNRAGLEVEDIGVRRPTLDEVFLRLTGHPAETPAEPATAEKIEVPA
jgi:ABC-type Na+ transport system ATPase subunit NatA